jgi:hypothetical protein
LITAEHGYAKLSLQTQQVSLKHIYVSLTGIDPRLLLLLLLLLSTSAI